MSAESYQPRRDGLPLAEEHGGGRYPGFSTEAQAPHWDQTTRAVVNSRLALQPDIRFFSPAEEATAGALFDQLMFQKNEPRVPIVQLVDVRLAENQTDGWHYDSLPQDEQAWRDSLAGLDADARERGAQNFADCEWDVQEQILQSILDRGSDMWHGFPADRVWGLWTRYAATAFYSHPWAWDEIGFAGPAYPRGYKNLGLDKLEPFEVPDAHPWIGYLPPDEDSAQDRTDEGGDEGPEQGSTDTGSAERGGATSGT